MEEAAEILCCMVCREKIYQDSVSGGFFIDGGLICFEFIILELVTTVKLTSITLGDERLGLNWLG